MPKKRLDVLLHERGLAPSRLMAKDAIESGIVLADGQLCIKPGAKFDEGIKIEVHGGLCPYVSRGGLKLERALDCFNINPAGFVCIDIGASTGGFTDCLLQRGAEKTFAIDVGHNQLADVIRNHPRVVVMEGVNVRHIVPEQIGQAADLVVIDVSFISLKLVLPVVYELIKDTGEVVCLIKPQFEAGRDKVSKSGVVRDPSLHAAVLSDFCHNCEDTGLYPQNLTFSPITGAKGNIEFLAHLVKSNAKRYNPNFKDIVAQAHISMKGLIK